MVLRHALFLIGAIPLSLASPGCVGTLAGAPQASLAATEGTAAIGAFVQPSGAAFVDPASPGNVIVPAKPDLFIIDGSGTLSVLVPDSALSMASDLLSAAGPGSGVFVADSVSIRLLDYATNKLIVIAGNVTSEASASSAGDGSRALGSLIQPPICLYVDIVLGDVYFCDGRNVVRVVRAAGPAAGQLQTVAGDGSAARSVDGALANETGFSDLWDASLTPNGDLVIAENDGFQYPRILLLSRSSGRVRALAGSADTTATYSYTGPTNAGLFFDGAQALGTPLLGAVSVCVQPVSGAVFFSDGYRVISLTAAGTLRILAGRRQAAASLVIDGAPSIESTFSGVPLVRPGGKASLIVTDTGTAVYRIDLATGRMHVVAGPALHEDITPASLQGGVFATSLTLPRNSLEDIAVDETGDVFLPILSANVILRVFAANGTASVIAGSGSPACTADGISDATAVGVPSVTGVALDGRGGLVFTERDCCLVLRLNLSNSALSILAGNTSSFCDGPSESNPPFSPGLLEVPALSLGSAFHVAIDRFTGDVFWTEIYGSRVIALRGGRGNAVRVAGTGEQSYEASGIIASGSVALTSSLSFPSAIAVDGSGAPVFINGYAPGCVLRLAPTGVLEVLVGLAMATGRDIADGPLSVATAFSLTALAVVNGASALLLADSSLRDPWSVVRRVDLASANISRIAGSFSGSENDGQSLLDTQFSYIRAIAQYSGENLALVEHYKGRVRIGVTSANTLLCAEGYSCSCGTLVPCSDPAFYCPAGHVEAIRVSRGRFATASLSSGAASAMLYSAEAPCPVGSYCISGVRFPCFPGSFGVDHLQSGPGGCALCPAGTFAAASGSVGAQSCLPCPAGTFSDVRGAAFCKPCPFFTANGQSGGNSSASCVSCGSAIVATEITGVSASLAGARVCVDLKSTSMFVANSFASAHLVVDPKGAAGGPDLLLVAIILPVAFLAALPMLYLATRHFVLRGRRDGLHWSFHRFERAVKSILRRYDLYSLRHKTIDGFHPVKLRTSLGGAWTALALGVIACIAIALIVQFIFSNILLTSSLLPAELPTLLGYASLPSHRVTALPSIAPATTPSGFELRVSTAGRDCGSPAFAVSALIAGSFSARVVSQDNATAAWEHAFVCADCAFGPLSSMTITFPPACQSFAIAATAVGASGSISAVSTAASSPSSTVNASTPSLSSIAVVLQPQLQVVNDSTRGLLGKCEVPVMSWRSQNGPCPLAACPLSTCLSPERGCSLQASSVSIGTAIAPHSVTLQVDLPVSNVYSLVQVVHVTTSVQLLSQLVGLIGLVSTFGALFYVLETWWFRPRRVAEVLSSSHRVTRARAVSEPGSLWATGDGVLRSRFASPPGERGFVSSQPSLMESPLDSSGPVHDAEVGVDIPPMPADSVPAQGELDAQESASNAGARSEPIDDGSHGAVSSLEHDPSIFAAAVARDADAASLGTTVVDVVPPDVLPSSDSERRPGGAAS